MSLQFYKGLVAMAAPSYALSLATANSADPAGDIITLIETRLTDAGWVWVEEVAFTQAATNRLMRVWKNPAALNAAGTNFFVGLVKNAAAGIYIAARAFEGYNATNHTMQRPCISGAATHYPVGGYTWTARTMPASGYSAVAYGNGVFVALRTSSTTDAAVSQDGITWTAIVMPVSQTWKSVVFGNGVFVAVGGSFNNIISATSTDGVTWTQRVITSSGGSSGYLAVAYGNGLFIAVGVTNASTSPDGITWTARNLPPGTFSSITYGAGLFVAVRFSSAQAISSPDGITWTARTMSANTLWASITFGGGMFVAVSSAAGTIAASSPDGITWTARTISVTGNWQSVTYGNGLFFTVGQSTAAASSPDGITWTTRTVLILPTVVCGNPAGQFVYAYNSSTAAGSWDYDPAPNWSAGNKDWLPDGSTQPPIAEAVPQAVLAVSTTYDVAVLASKSYLVLGAYLAGTGQIRFGWVLGLVNPVYPDSPTSFPPLGVITTTGAAISATGGVSRSLRNMTSVQAFSATTGPESLLIGTAFAGGVNEPAGNLLRTARVAVGGAQSAAFSGAGYRGWLSDSVAVGVSSSSTSAKPGDTVTIGASTYTVLVTSGGTSANSFQGSGACVYAFDVTAGS